MATAKHGRKGRMLLDMASTPGGAATIVPMLVDWSKDGSRDEVDTTSCDSEQKEFVYGFGNWNLSINLNMDADSDALYEACDGERRLMYFYPDRDAAVGKLRYEYGMVVGSLSESGGAAAKLGQSATFKAAGAITRVFV